MELSSPELKKTYISGWKLPSSKNKKNHSENISYNWGNGTFYPQA